MLVERKEIISKIEFKNGLTLEVGDVFEDGRIFSIEEDEDGFEVVCLNDAEGWSVLVNNDGEILD